ncbi:MAG: efflux RND transporter periplasmic adaptor subunit [Verrucomicrobiota bacterium]
MSQTLQRAAKRHTRRWLPYAGAVVLVALITAGLWPRPIPVETARATIGTLRATVNEQGKTRIKQRYVVSAPVTGQLQRIPFKAGAEVRADQTVVAVIEPVSPTLLDARTRVATEAKRDTALANLEKARAGQRFAASDLRRFEKLHAEKMVSVQELESVQLREASATKEQAAAESALRQVEAEMAEFAGNAPTGTNTLLDPVQVKAPATGSVLHIFEENSRVVAAGTTLMEIGDPLDIEVVVEVLSRDGAAIPPGTPVELEQWGGGEPLKAKVRLVEPAAFTKISALGVEEQRVNVIADLLTPPDQRRNVGDGFRVEARIIVWEATDALKVPAGALFRKGEQWAAFVIADGRARLKIVKAGRSSGTETQVIEGLKQGEEVILYPGSRVRDGQRVTPVIL